MSFQESFNSRVIPAAERLFGVLVSLTHGEIVTDPFTAIREDQRYESAEQEGFGTSFQSSVFTFPIESASFLGERFEPQKGDTIALTENGVEKKFEILSVPGLRSVELMPGGYRWKVHTKQVK